VGPLQTLFETVCYYCLPRSPKPWVV